MARCSVDGCDVRNVARGMCDIHYQRWLEDRKDSHGRHERVCACGVCGLTVTGGNLFVSGHDGTLWSEICRKADSPFPADNGWAVARAAEVGWAYRLHERNAGAVVEPCSL